MKSRTALALVLACATSALADPPERAPGLRAAYYAGTDFEELLAERIDRRIEIPERDHLWPDGRAEDVSVQWTGFLTIERDGEYRFRAEEVDDGFRLWIDDQVVMPRWLYQSDQGTETVRLERGTHPIRAEFFNEGGGGRLRLAWSGPGFKDRPLEEGLETPPWKDMDPLPAETFADPGKRVPGLRAVYYRGEDFDERAVEQIEPALRVDGRFPFRDGRYEELSIRWIGALRIDRGGGYRFRVTHDDGCRLWIGNRLVVDGWEGHGEAEGRVRLEKGWHPLRCDYNQGKGDMRLDLEWDGPGVERGPIPPGRLATTPWRGMAAAKPMVVLLMLGHSNLGGRSEKPFDRVSGTWMYEANERRWRLPTDGDRGGAAALLHHLARARPDVQLGAIKVVHTGSKVGETWQPGRRGYQEALEAARRLPGGAVLGGVVTFLGWPDAGESKGDEPERFEERYRRLVRDLRRDLKRPDLAWIASRVEFGKSAMESDERRARWQIVYDAFPKLAKDPGRLAVVESEGCDLIDNHHYSYKGYQRWARRAVEACREVELLDRALARVTDLRKGRGVPARVLAAPPATAYNARDTLAEVEAVVRRHSRARDIENLGTYKHALVVTEYEVRKVIRGELPGKRFLTAQLAIRDRRLQAAHDYRRGEVHRLRLGSWSAQTRWHGEALDDDIVDLSAAMYWVHDARKVK